MVDFECAENPLDELHAGPGARRLDRDVNHPEDFHARSHFDIQRSHAFRCQVTLGDGSNEGRELGLHAVQVGVAAKLKFVSHEQLPFSMLLLRSLP